MTSPTDDRLCRSFRYEAEVTSVAMARRDVGEFVVDRLGAIGFGDRVPWVVDRLLLIVSELCGNAVEAAPGTWFQVDITIDDGTDGAGSRKRRPPAVICSVKNPNDGDMAEIFGFAAIDEPLAERGRGLVIVKGFADRVRSERSPTTTVVIAELDLEADT